MEEEFNYMYDEELGRLASKSELRFPRRRKERVIRVERIEESGMDEELLHNTLKQLGMRGHNLTDDDLGTLKDIAEHGAADGWPGFTYYSDTYKFFRDNKEAILEYASEQAEAFGTDMLEMIASFNCLKDYELSPNEVARSLYGNSGELNTQILNAMSWYILEEVSRFVSDGGAAIVEVEYESPNR